MKEVSKLLIFIFITGMFFTACEKEQLKEVILEETPTPEIFFKNGHLNFNSIEVYDKTIASLSNEKTLDNLKLLNENPLSNLKKSGDLNEELYDDFLLSILNEDEVVQIDQWVIKVDMENELVSVINENNINYYEDLVENIDNDSIYKFSTEDEVLDLLAEGSTGTVDAKQLKGWFCRDSKAVAHYSSTSNIGYLTSRQEVKVRYYKAGIYFSLYAIVKNSGVFYGSEQILVTMDLGYEFFDRCGRSYDRSPYRHEIKAGRFPTNEIKKKVYEHVRNLAKYKLDTKFELKYYNFYGNYAGTLIINKSIRSNM